MKKSGCSWVSLFLLNFSSKVKVLVAPPLVHILAKKKRKKILGHASGRGLLWVWSRAWVVGVDQ
jgi:hypothetical protein